MMEYHEILKHLEMDELTEPEMRRLNIAVDSGFYSLREAMIVIRDAREDKS